VIGHIPTVYEKTKKDKNKKKILKTTKKNSPKTEGK
tara:strand:- start:384 stop:491 length:108 start_codon:yes stop_codon:yes gene_type:complete